MSKAATAATTTFKKERKKEQSPPPPPPKKKRKKKKEKKLKNVFYKKIFMHLKNIILLMICLLHSCFYLPANFTKAITNHYGLKIDWGISQ